jgi:hypothetical protein
MLVRVDARPDEEIWEAPASAKREGIDYISSKTDAGMGLLDPDPRLCQ